MASSQVNPGELSRSGQDTRDILSEIRHQNDAIHKALQDAAGKTDDSVSLKMFKGEQKQNQKAAKQYFANLGAPGSSPTKQLESQFHSDASSYPDVLHNHDYHSAGDAKESIEGAKCERTLPGFMKAVKDNKELWTIFLEHFPAEESFAKLIESKRFASALSGVMKMIVDYHSLEEHKKRSQRMKQEAELLEKHKAYLRNSAAIANMVSEANLASHKSPRDGLHSGSEPNIDAAFMVGSARTGTDHYQLVQTEALAGSHHNTTKKNLPTYDLERILKLAEDAELNSKRRGGLARKGDRGTSRSADGIAFDQQTRALLAASQTQHINTRGSNRKSSAGRLPGDDLQLDRDHVHFDYLGENRYNNPRGSHSSREDSPGLSPLNKLEVMRQEMKRKKSGQTDSGSPSPAKEEEDKRTGFLAKMRDFDYSSLVNSKEQQGNDYGFQSRVSQKERDSKKIGLNQKRGAEGNQGLFDLTDTDGERRAKGSNSPKGFARTQLGQGPIDLAKMTWARETHDSANQHGGFGGKTEQKNSIVIKRDRERQKDSNTANSRLTPSLFDTTNKKLTPLVPESAKKDYFAKVEEERSKKTHTEKSANQRSVKERSASGSESRRLGRQRFHPPLDNKNPGYRSAFESGSNKQFVVDAGIPDYRSAVSSSNYGRISKSRSKERSGSSGKRKRPDTVKSLLNSVLSDSKARGNYGLEHSRYGGESGGLNKSRNNQSLNKCSQGANQSAGDRDRSAGSGRSSSHRKSDFGNDARGDLYDIKKLDPLTSHQQKRHFPDKDQFINSAAGGSSSNLIQ